MSKENNVFIINRQALARIAQEMESQEALTALLLTQCLDQLDDINRKLHAIMSANACHKARGAFLQLFMTDEEWEKIITDKQIGKKLLYFKNKYYTI